MARQFNGTSDYASAALNLSGTTVVSVSFWLWWDAYAGDDDLAMEFTTNSFGGSDGFMFDVNWSGTGGVQGLLHMGGTPGGPNQYAYNNPSAAVWHHFLAVMDKTLSTNEATVWIDGATPAGASRPSNGDNSNVFANSTLYLMTRAGTGLYGAGRMANVGVWTAALNAAELASLAAGGSPTGVRPGSLFAAWRMGLAGSTDVDLSGNGRTLTYSGTTLVADPPSLAQQRAFRRSQAVSRSAVR